MSRIHINRERQNLGQFSPEDVSSGLQSGRFLPTDLAWREGMESWQPLATFTDLPPPEEAIAAPTFAPGSEILPPPAAVAPEWERNSGAGLVTRLYESVREILGNPQATFAGMPTTGGLTKPLVFVMIMAGAGSVISLLYQLAYELLGPKGSGVRAEVSPGLIVGTYIGVMIFMPVFVAIGSFISAGVMHVCLMLTGAEPKSFEATYRVVAYTNGATSVMLLLPLCGGLVQGCWNLYLLVIGFREVHGTTTTRAIIAVLLPVLLCCGAAIGILTLVAIPAINGAAR